MHRRFYRLLLLIAVLLSFGIACESQVNNTSSDDNPVTSTSPSTPMSDSPVSASIIRINCGGDNYTSAQGEVWSADTGFSTDSATYQVSETIANADEPELYQTERYGTPELQYTIAVPNGQYTLNLHFAELYVTQPGGRVFHVEVEGDRVLSDFDTVAEAGGARRAVVRSFTVTVTDGRLDINFIAVTTEHWGRVNAIELIPLGNTAS